MFMSDQLSQLLITLIHNTKYILGDLDNCLCKNMQCLLYLV